MTPTNGGSPAGFEGTVVLTEGGTGLVVVPSPTPLTRLNYYDGKFLRAADLTLEQLGQRMLVELSNRTGGPGITSGFDVSIGSGDVLSLSAGLAIDPQGRVLFLPAPVTVTVAELIRQSREQALPAIVESNGTPVFADCEVATTTPTVQTTVGTDLYLITIGHTEGLCGNEEVFGRLCDDACITANDRPYVLEGVVLRAIPLGLSHTLATSTAVALGNVHLRSRVASAYFADEWDRGGSLLSAVGLASPLWCRGAAAMAGDTVPVGVLARAGSATLFLDEWTARRERIEPPPRRYWDGRMELRPWDVFLAQVLQFQCQLAGILSGGPAVFPGGTDPCVDATSLLKESVRLMDELRKRAFPPEANGGLVEMKMEKADALSGLETFELRSNAVLDRVPVVSSHVLIDGGIIELPPAGYLPVDPRSTTTLPDQVQRLMGNGVDLDYCAVRRDQIAHELERAQHMNRISLLTGLDDPAHKQEVDILVPDGQVEAIPATTPGIGFDVDAAFGLAGKTVLAGASSTDAFVEAATTDTSTLPIKGAARLLPGDTGGVQFVCAASMAPGDRTAAIGVMKVMARSAAGSAAFTDALERVKNLGDAQPEVSPMERVAADVHESAAVARTGDETIHAITVEQPAAEPQTLVMWLTFNTDRNPFATTQGDLVGVQASLDAYAPARPAQVVHHDVVGRLIIDSVTAIAGGTRVTGRFAAGLDSSHLGLRGVEAAPPSVTLDVILTSEVVSGVPRITVRIDEGDVQVTFAAEWTGAPIQAKALLVAGVGDATARAGARALLQEDASITRGGTTYHDIAVQAITILQGAMLDDPGYLERATQQLFPTAPGTGTARVTPTLDWVLFRRRRREDCGEVVALPAPPSEVALWSVKAGSQRDAVLMARALGTGEPVDAEWTRMGTAEFETGTAARITTPGSLEQQWLGAQAGSMIFFAGYGATGGGVTPVDRPRAQSLVDGVARVAQLDPKGSVDVVVRPPRDQLVTGTEGSVFFVTYDPPQPKVSCMEVFAVDDVNSSPDGKKLLDALEQGGAEFVDQVGGAIQPEGSITFTDDQPDQAQLQQVVDAVEQHRNDLGHGLFGARFPRVLAWIAKGFDPDIGKQMAETVAGAFGYAFFGPAVLAGVDFEPGDGCPVRLYVLEFLG